MICSENQGGVNDRTAGRVVFFLHSDSIASGNLLEHSHSLIAEVSSGQVHRDIDPLVHQFGGRKTLPKLENIHICNGRRVKEGRNEIAENRFSGVTNALHDNEPLGTIIRYKSVTKCLPSSFNVYRIPSKNLLQKAVKLGTYLCTQPVHLNAAGEEKVRRSTEQLECVQIEQAVTQAQEIR